MIVTVRDLRIRLERALGLSDGDDRVVKQFLTSLADCDDMAIADFLKYLGCGGLQQTPAPRTQPPDPSEIVSRLKSAMPNDDAFHGAMNSLAGQRSVTKPVLARVYSDLFQRKQGVPKKATRSDLLRLIEDERNIVVRNQKMGQLLGQRVVPAE